MPMPTVSLREEERNVSLYEQLSKRCLFKSIDIMLKLDILQNASISYNYEEMEIITNFQLKNYYLIYSKLLRKCKISKSGSTFFIQNNLSKIFFCTCCSRLNNFIRNYCYIILKSISLSEISSIYSLDDNILEINEYINVKEYNLKNKKEKKNDGIKDIDELDSYELYLLALVTKDRDKKIKILMTVLEENISLFDSIIEIIDVIKMKDIRIIDKLLYQIKKSHKNVDVDKIIYLYSLELYVQKFIKNRTFKEALEYFTHYKKDLEFKEQVYERNRESEIELDNFKGNCLNGTEYNYDNKLNNIENNYELQISNNLDSYRNNILGAVYYQLKEYNKSVEYFKNVLLRDCYVEYLDMYSNILYINGDKCGVSNISINLLYFHPFRGESMSAIANYYSIEGDRMKAIEYFKKSIRLERRFVANWVLIGHEFMEMKNYDKAVGAYGLSLAKNSSDFRGWFGMAQSYVNLNAFNYGLYFFKKAVELNEKDGYLWVCLGNCYLKIKKTKESLECYLRAVKEGTYSGYLFAGDIFKNNRKYKEAVNMYEQYIEWDKNGDQRRKIIGFLKEYYGKIGNKEKVKFYSDIV
ncbi:Cell division control protein CDC23-like protein [Spraguea lophii 42_110]|uniref:Cell division control protein CDC23-like protein n=1 Tax=Spraguea lophii (strain 42_110) TaxID=1358809 RepID=S7WCP6_SPRLO|nr:Cell division control protein CDC23-like protein [Spraguea lophii 42_110]